MKIEHITNARGQPIANQFIIYADAQTTLLQSYDSIVAKIVKHGSNRLVWLDKQFWNYSATTAKYRNLFLQETTDQTQQKINSGEYRLTDLNQ